MAKSNHTRSISFPSTSHPSIQKVEEELNKLKTLQLSATPEAATICSGLLGLEQLYKSIDDVLNLPQTLQALSQYQNKKWADDLMEKSVRILDVCGLAREAVSQLTENLRDLQSSLRRKKEDSSIEAIIIRYTSFRKKMNKDARKSIASIRKMDDEIGRSSFLTMEHDISAAIRVLREASAVNVCIFEGIILLLSIPLLKPKPSRWSIVAKLVQNGSVACEDQQNKICNLEILETELEVIEKKLESIFRCLIKYRSSLLNVVSC